MLEARGPFRFGQSWEVLETLEGLKSRRTGCGEAGSPCCLRCHTALVLQNTCWQPRCPDFWGLGGFWCHVLKCPQGAACSGKTVVHLAVDILHVMPLSSPVVAVLLVLIVKGQTWLLLAYPFSAHYRLLLNPKSSCFSQPSRLPPLPFLTSLFLCSAPRNFSLASEHPWFYSTL